MDYHVTSPSISLKRSIFRIFGNKVAKPQNQYKNCTREDYKIRKLHFKINLIYMIYHFQVLLSEKVNFYKKNVKKCLRKFQY